MPVWNDNISVRGFVFGSIPVSDPFPSVWDLIWSLLQLVGVPFLVLLPGMFLIWVIEWIHTGRTVAAGARATVRLADRGWDAANASTVFRVCALVLFEAIAAATIWGTTTWLVATIGHPSLSHPPPSDPVTLALSDPVARQPAFIALSLSIGLALAYNGARAARNQFAMNVAGFLCALVSAGLGLLACGSALLALFGWAAYGWPPDQNTSMFIGLALLGGVGTLCCYLSATQLDRVFPQRVKAKEYPWA